jgi:alanine racemase
MPAVFNPNLYDGSEPIIRIKNTNRVFECCRHFQKVAKQRGGRLAAVVKADGYGFGIESMIPPIIKSGINHVYTSDVSEASIIRDSGFQGDLFILNGFSPRQNNDFHRLNAIPILSSQYQIKEYMKFASQTGMRKQAVLQFDTGMNRNGLSPEDSLWLQENFRELEQRIDIDHYLTHLHSVDLNELSDQSSSLRQINRFCSCIEKLPKKPTSIFSTHGILYIDPKVTSSFENQIYRVGVGLLGDIYEQTMAMQIHARVNEVRTVRQGEGIGYDQIFTAQNDMRIAVVDIGYGDGYSRGLNVTNEQINDRNRPYMMIDHQACHVVGKISMNMTAIDISELNKDVNPTHDFAEVIGPNVDIRRLANYAQTAPEELMINMQASNRRAKDIISPQPKRR